MPSFIIWDANAVRHIFHSFCTIQLVGGSPFGKVSWLIFLGTLNDAKPFKWGLRKNSWSNYLRCWVSTNDYNQSCVENVDGGWLRESYIFYELFLEVVRSSWLPEQVWMTLGVSWLTSWCMCGSRYALLIFAEHFLYSQTSFSPSSWVKPGKPQRMKLFFGGLSCGRKLSWISERRWEI